MLLFLLDTLSLRSVDLKLVICRVCWDLALKHLTFSLQSIFVRSQAFQLSLCGLRLIQDHFDSLHAVLLVVELTSENVIEMLTVLSCFVAQIIEHLFRSEIITSDFLGVHETLTSRQKLVLAHFNHLCKFTLFFVEASILLLLFTQLRGGIKE